MKNAKEIHIGERIKEIFDQKNISITQFADLLHCDRANVYNIFRRKKIDVDLLLEISNILNHDFVEEVCAKHEFSKDLHPSKVYFVLEIHSMDDKLLENLLKTIKQMEIKTIREIRN